MHIQYLPGGAGSDGFPGMRILITGGAGFLGSHLCERLLNEGNEVICMDNFFTGRKRNVLHLMDNPYFELVRHDVIEPFKFEVDQIYNLACPASPPHYQHNPIKTTKTSVMGAINCLGLAKRVGARVFQASTSEVYGTARYVPIDENHPFQGQSPYSATKIGADRIAESFYRSFDLPVTIVRPFNTYGPRQSARAVIPTIITQLLAGADEIKLGSLVPTRDLTFVSDTCAGMIAIANSDATVGQEINIATQSEISVGDLAQKLIQKIRPQARVVQDNERLRPEKSEVERLFGANGKIKELTGWTPQVSLDEGLDQAIAWFRAPGNLQRYKPQVYNV